MSHKRSQDECTALSHCSARTIFKGIQEASEVKGWMDVQQRAQPARPRVCRTPGCNSTAFKGAVVLQIQRARLGAGLSSGIKHSSLAWLCLEIRNFNPILLITIFLPSLHVNSLEITAVGVRRTPSSRNQYSIPSKSSVEPQPLQLLDKGPRFSSHANIALSIS